MVVHASGNSKPAVPASQIFTGSRSPLPATSSQLWTLRRVFLGTLFLASTTLGLRDTEDAPVHTTMMAGLTGHCSSPLKAAAHQKDTKTISESSLRPPFSPVLRTRTTKETTAVCFGSRHPAQFTAARPSAFSAARKVRWASTADRTMTG